MYRVKKTYIICLMTIVSLCTIFTTISYGKSPYHIIGWEPWKPFIYEDPLHRLKGADIDFIRRIIENMGLFTIYKRFSWKRHLIEIQKGRIDIAIGAFKTAKREKYAYFSEPYRKKIINFYIRTEDRYKYGFIQSLKDIIGIPLFLSTTYGCYYGETFSELIKQANFEAQIIKLLDEQQKYNLLKQKRVDAILADPLSIKYGLEQAGMAESDIMKLFTVYVGEVYVIFSKASTPSLFVERFNKHLAKLKHQGVIYRNIYSKYITTKSIKQFYGLTSKKYRTKRWGGG